jgi:glutamate racemase
MKSKAPAIGLFDSGVGGLTVLRELQLTLPHFDFVYLGDSARFPYGSKSASTIAQYSKECAEFLVKQDVEMIVVACNTASSFALNTLVGQYQLPIIGTIESAVCCALQATKTGRIGVLGTEGTISSRVYEKRLAAFNPDLHVYSKACPLFVALVEEGMLSGEIVDQVVELYLSELKTQNIDTLILGCTHYPLLANAIRGFLGDSISLIECSAAVAQEASKTFGQLDSSIHNTHGSTKFFVTDDPKHFSRLAPKFLGGVQIESKLVDIRTDS